ncbi:MAG: type II secretion system protein [Verrucomicrobiota bacterium]
MKFSFSNSNPTGARVGCLAPRSSLRPASAFTMIEIAICLAIIGFALVAIIGVLPIGMNAQRDNREETLITQDANFLINAIRTGARGVDDLTNYVFSIFNSSGGYSNFTSGARIIGLLSTPGITNYANVRAISGLASQKPPQDNSLVRDDGFSYRLVCMSTPVAVVGPLSEYSRQLTNSQWELRLRFLWPLLPNGNYGNGRQTFRATIAGQLVSTNSGLPKLFYYQPQSFTNAPYLP